MTLYMWDDGVGDGSPAGSADEVQQLRQALASRPVIDQAKGMLMAQHGCSADEAFDMLRQASNRGNRKLREIALAIVETWSRASLPPA